MSENNLVWKYINLAYLKIKDTDILILKYIHILQFLGHFLCSTLIPIFSPLFIFPGSIHNLKCDPQQNFSD